MDTLKVIRRNPLFRGLDEKNVREALTLLNAQSERYARGETLLCVGAPFSAFGIVLEGSVQVYMDDFGGERMMMASVGVGDSFGESHAYLSTEESPVYILAATDASVLWLSPLVFKGRAADDLAVLLRERFTALLAMRALYQNERIQILSKPTIRARVIAFLTQWEARTQSKTFSVPFDRAALATYLGVNRSALSRELAAMKREGLLDFYRSAFRLT